MRLPQEQTHAVIDDADLACLELTVVAVTISGVGETTHDIRVEVRLTGVPEGATAEDLGNMLVNRKFITDIP